jgi:hypothetical protein
MMAQDLPLVPVVEAGRLVGVLARDDVARGLRLYQLQRHATGWHTAGTRERTA